VDDAQIKFLLFGAAIPAAVGAVAGIAARLAAARARLRLGAALAVLGIGLAFLAAYPLINGAPPRWPPADSESRLFLLAAGLTVLCAAAAAVRRQAAVWLVAALASLAAPVAILWPVLSRAISRGTSPSAEQAAWGLGGAAACALIALPVHRTAGRDTLPRSAAIILAGTCAAAGAALAASHSMKLAQFALAAAAATAACGLIAPHREPALPEATSRSTVAVPALVAAILAALLVAGGAYGELHPGVAAAITLAPLAGLLAAYAPLNWPAKRTWGRVAAAALVATGAIIAVAILSQSDAADYLYDY